MSKYTLIVAEKPDAANRIANALDESGHAKRMQQNGVPYYEAKREKQIIVVPAVGHLYTVASPGKNGHGYPVFNYEWIPRYKVERGASKIRVWLQTISKLAKEAEVFIDACDYDIEGSIIGYCILKYACGGKENEAKRMKYSTLMEEELQKSYSELLPHLDFGLIESGLARHEVDWLYGINLSRALTTASKNHGKQYATLSTGRVQGPTLKFLAARERTIACFVPTPFWTLKVKAKIGNEVFDVEYEKRVFEVKQEAETVVACCKSKTGIVEDVTTKKFLQSPPLPFDLGALQHEAYRFFGYTPMGTASVAQRLYLDALISYPRTSSQKLPKEIGYEKILENLAKNREYALLAGELLAKPELKPSEGKKWDSAHPAIYPTGKFPQKGLVGAEKTLYDLVVRRFMAVFGEAAKRQTVKVSIKVSGEEFCLQGKQTTYEGWLRFYKPFVRLQDIILPQIKTGDNAQIKKIVAEEKFTKPPPRYNPASLLRKMEQGNIGTKATRAGTMQTLYDRKYIREDKIVVTDLGFEVTDVLRKYCPSVVSVDFTRQLEEKMGLIQQGKETKSQIILNAVEFLKPVLTSLKDNEKAVGEQLSCAVSQAKLKEKMIGQCPTCKDGNLIIQHSKKSGKRFVGCTNYFNGSCKTAYPLPQRGYVKPSDKTCPSCGLPTVTVWFKIKRPRNLCFNPVCPSKKSPKAIA